jgi:hypothetical protein
MICGACCNRDHEMCLSIVSMDGTPRPEAQPSWCACQHRSPQDRPKKVHALGALSSKNGVSAAQ